MLNPSFDDGTTSFYYADDRTNMKVSILANAALIYDRSTSDRALVQDLDYRCFYPNAQYTISAKFKLLNNTGLSAGVSCDTNAHSGTTQCPSIRRKFKFFAVSLQFNDTYIVVLTYMFL